MKVVLLKNVEKLGTVGEEKEVKNGFARNWLIARKLAVRFNDPQAKEIIAKARQEREKIAREIEELKKLADKLAGETIKIKAKAGSKGKLFGSVTVDQVSKALKIDKNKITMPPIRETGEHNVIIKLGHGVEGKLKIEVIAEKDIKNKK